jgi:hypothetical protein
MKATAGASVIEPEDHNGTLVARGVDRVVERAPLTLMTTAIRNYLLHTVRVTP